MPEDELAAKIAGHRETAETLRGIAERLRFEPRRGNQLRALADGFERFALLLERASIKRIAADSTASASSPARRSARPAASATARLHNGRGSSLGRQREAIRRR